MLALRSQKRAVFRPFGNSRKPKRFSRLMLGGFVWVIGDLFQQYAAKYLVSAAVPLSNTNQLWGLLWGLLVFGELHGMAAGHYASLPAHC